MSTNGPKPLFPEESQWIWPADCGTHPNQYVEIRQAFTCGEEFSTTLSIAADARYAVWINEHFIGQGPFPDWPQTRSVDVWDPAKALKTGDNLLRIRLHWIGEDTASYVQGDPGIIYCLSAGTRTLAASGEGAEWMRTPVYQTKGLPRMTPQLGFSFAYNAGLESALNDKSKWSPVTSVDSKPVSSTGRTFRERPLALCQLVERAPAEVIAQGFFKKADYHGQKHLASRMQQDWLSARTFNEIFGHSPTSGTVLGMEPLPVSPPVSSRADGIYWIIDLGTDVYGYLELEIATPEPVLLEIAYGEHLDDLRVRSHVGQRFFAVSYQSRKGHQVFLEPITPIGCRYLQVHASGFTKDFKLHYLGLRPLRYPITARGTFKSSDAMEQRIYDTCVRTLQLCMGNHYFDTPWREQALYANDLLNQSLAGYYVFGDYQYSQVSLDLLGAGLREDGFLELCAPARLPITIPAFSFAWVVAVEKNLLYSGDIPFVRSQFKRVESILNLAASHICEDLLPSPTGSGYWHFYDWTPGGLDGTEEGDATRFASLRHQRFDAPLNAFFVLALEAGVRLAESLEAHATAAAWAQLLKEMRPAFHRLFFEPACGIYRTFNIENATDPRPSELVQALALCAQCCPAAEAALLRKQLLHPEEEWIPSSLSQSLYTFEALAQDSSLIEPMLKRVNSIWGGMIAQGASTFWETLEGRQAFDGAGSLCHGWSAIPAYLYGAYLLGVRPLTPGFKTFTRTPLKQGQATGAVPTPQELIQVI